MQVALHSPAPAAKLGAGELNSNSLSRAGRGSWNEGYPFGLPPSSACRSRFFAVMSQALPSAAELATQVAALQRDNAALRDRLARAEEREYQTRQVLQVVIDTIPHLVAWKDCDSVYQGCNQQFAAIAGFASPAGSAGKTDYDAAWTRAEADWHRQCDREAIESGEAQLHIIETQRQADGTQAWLDTCKIPLRDATGRVIGLAAVIEDITARKQAEAEQQKLLALTENSHDFIGVTDAQGRLIYLNPSGCRLAGLRDFAAARTQFMADFLPPEQRPRFAEIVQSVATHNTYWQGEWQLQNFQTGERIDIDMTLFCLEDANGDRLLATISRDIRDRKQTERAIQEANARFRRITESVPGTIFQYCQPPDDSLGYFTYLSPGCRELYEMEPEVALQHQERLWQMVHPEDLPKLQASVLLAQKTGLDWHYQYRLVLPGDRLKWLQATSRARRDRDGTVVWDGILLDVTKRQQAEATLRDREQRLNWLFEQSPLAAIEWNKDFRVVDWNQAATTLFGHSKAEALDKNPAELGLVPIDAWPLVEPLVQQLIEGRGGVFNINDNLTRDGRRITCEWHNVPLRNDEGQFVSVLSKVQDVTEREQAKQLLQQQKRELEETLQELQQTQLNLIQSEKMSSLGQLVAGIAHEINNPVNFIYGNLAPAAEYVEQLITLLETYRQQFPDPGDEIAELIDEIDLEFLVDDIAKLLGSMQVGAERIREIVRSLRIFSRVDEAEYKEADIHAGIDSTLTILENRIKAKPERPGIQVVRDYGQLPLVECYAGQLNQVFMNVLANAIDALEERDAERSYAAIREQPSRIAICTRALGDRASISFADNGPGLPPEIRERIFNPFFTTKPTGKGTGLGLSISYQIVTEKHGGLLHCQSEPGQGCEFIIEIPLRQPKVEVERASSKDARLARLS